MARSKLATNQIHFSLLSPPAPTLPVSPQGHLDVDPFHPDLGTEEGLRKKLLLSSFILLGLMCLLNNYYECTDPLIYRTETWSLPLPASIQVGEDLSSTCIKGGKETDFRRGPPLSQTPCQLLQTSLDLFSQQLGENEMSISRHWGSERFSNFSEFAQLVSVRAKV